MPLGIAQAAKYEGDDWWEWSVWIEAEESELDAIEFVQYTLHHTFPQPVRRISDRTTHFRLKSSGWGGFTIYAKAVQKDRSETTLQHELKLYYPRRA
jgi:transcription initiation factor IIF auxiliary subunit